MRNIYFSGRSFGDNARNNGDLEAGDSLYTDHWFFNLLGWFYYFKMLQIYLIWSSSGYTARDK